MKEEGEEEKKRKKTKGIIHAKSLKQEQACPVLGLGGCSLANKETRTWRRPERQTGQDRSQRKFDFNLSRKPLEGFKEGNDMIWFMLWKDFEMANRLVMARGPRNRNRVATKSRKHKGQHSAVLILTVVVVIQIYTWDKTAQDSTRARARTQCTHNWWNLNKPCGLYQCPLSISLFWFYTTVMQDVKKGSGELKGTRTSPYISLQFPVNLHFRI